MAAAEGIRRALEAEKQIPQRRVTVTVGGPKITTVPLRITVDMTLPGLSGFRHTSRA